MRLAAAAGLSAAFLAAMATLTGAVWLVSELPDSRQKVRLPDTGTPQLTAGHEPPEHNPIEQADSLSVSQPVRPVSESASSEPDEPGETPYDRSETASPSDWLDPYYGLDSPVERRAMEALVALSDTLDFGTFDTRIKALADRREPIVDYLILDFRAFLRLDDRLTEIAFVRRPYLERARSSHARNNWLAWLFMDLPTVSPLTHEQKRAGVEAALRGHDGAQAVFAHRSAWFSDAATDRETESIRQLMQSENPFLTLLQMRETGRNLWQRPEARKALEGLSNRLQRSSDVLSQWLGQGLPRPDNSQTGFTVRGLKGAAGEGYLTALEELRLLATRGTGRWMRTGNVSVPDALSAFRQAEAVFPDNPVISGSLCELTLHHGDYQAAWFYLRKMAYRDQWSGEVEDYSCLPGQDSEFARQMVRYGVITKAQWQAHTDTIDRRRQEIRNGHRAEPVQ